MAYWGNYCKQKNLQGFTLIELMVVLAIIGLILGVVTTRIDFLIPGSRLNAAAREIASSLALANSHAAVSGRSVIIRYDMGNRFHCLILPATSPNKKREALAPNRLPDGVHFQDINVAGKEYLSKRGAWVEISITPLGTVQPHVIHLVNDNKNKVTIEVNPVTGLVQIKEGEHAINFFEDIE